MIVQYNKININNSYTKDLSKAIINISVGPNLLLELFDKILEQSIVEIFAAKQRVSVGGFDFKHAFLYLKDRDVESSTTKIIYRNSTSDYHGSSSHNELYQTFLHSYIYTQRVHQ